MEDVTVSRTALQEEFHQKRVKIARQIQDLHAKDRIDKLKKVMRKHRARWVEHMENVLDNIDSAVVRLGPESSEAKELRRVLIGYGHEVHQLDLQIQRFLDCSLDAYYHAYILNEIKDLDIITRLERLATKDFPLYAHLHGRSHSRFYLDLHLFPGHAANPIPWTLGAIESKRHSDDATRECQAFEKVVIKLRIAEQFRIGDSREVCRGIFSFLSGPLAAGQSRWIHDIKAFQQVRGQDTAMIEFLEAHGCMNSTALIEHYKNDAEAKANMQKLKAVLHDILLSNPQFALPATVKSLEQLLP